MKINLKFGRTCLSNQNIRSSANQVFEYTLLAACFLGIFFAFALLPLPGGDDWQTFYGAARRVLTNVPLYGKKITFSYFFNPPWLALILSPLGLLPFRFGWSAINTLSILNVFLLSKRWELSAVKMIAVLLSPPILYTLLHGNLDVFILGAVLLPTEYWVIAAITKPQTAIALSIGAINSSWRKTACITIGVILLSFVLLGNWIPAYLSQPMNLIDAGHNVFRGLWPYQVFIGLGLAYYGRHLQDEKFLLAASPFFSPYAATSSMLGPLFLLMSKLNNWQAVFSVVMYWIISIMMRFY